MKLQLLAVGRMKAGPERLLLQRYLDRLDASARGLGLSALQIIEIDESRAGTADQRRRDEAAALARKLGPGAVVIMLDEGGASLTSEAFAALVARHRDGGSPTLAFVVGGPDGIDPSWRERHSTLAFGAATFPHQLVRVLVAEQVYRAITILSGHPYHRG